MSELNKKFISGFSIVLCTHNGKSRLQPTLDHLSALQLPSGFDVELVLVDNASTDDTTTYVQQLWEVLGAPFPLHLYIESRTGKGFAIETGYDAASFSYIVTVDDDNWLSPCYLLHAADLFKQDSDIGILQGCSEGVFETPPPSWVENLKEYYIIGSPIKEPGYFVENEFWVWGAGMIIVKADWENLRNVNFSALTSKMPGKAAGEDNETAIGILMLGKKIYYSDKLKYKHYMPANRISYKKLKQNFETFGYVSYYFFLYGLTMDAYENKYLITEEIIKERFVMYWLKRMYSFSWKQHIAYFIMPRKDVYQLRLLQQYAQYRWYRKLLKRSVRDVAFIQSWMLPLLERHPGTFKWCYEV